MKIRPTLKKIIKIVLVIAFYIGLYLLTKDHFEQFGQLTTDNINISWTPLVLALLLVAPNWLLEAVKWRISLSPVEKVSFGVSFVGVLKGITPSLFTPNRVGEALGRPSVLQHGHRLSGGLATAYCGLSQMPVMMLFSFVPMLAMFNDIIKKGAVIFYTQQLKMVFDEMSWSAFGAKNTMILCANALIFVLLFAVLYHKKGLE